MTETSKNDKVTIVPADIKEQMIYQRAVEAAIWGLPAVNYQLMVDELVKIKGSFNQVVIWPGLLDWKNQTLTPNQDVIYSMAFFNTKDVGPVVLEIPPADDGIINGSIMDYWQAAIEDVGPGGVDKGKGGKYVFLPPGYDKSKISGEYIPMQSYTYQGYTLMRSIPKSNSEENIKQAVSYSRRIKVYPFSEAANPRETVYNDAGNNVYDSTIPYDHRFYKVLNKIIQAEPWLERDRAMIDLLKTIGIERGKQFNPSVRTQDLLSSAVVTAKAWLEYNYESMPPFYEGTYWFFPATEETHQSILNNFRVADSYPTDNRGMLYMMAFFSAKHIGESQYYLMNIFDKNGKPLEGNTEYRLNVPANIPVTQYWSMTVYNRDTHTFIRNTKKMGCSSKTQGLQTNSDGSVDIYFGPRPPVTGETNWIPTDANGGFEVLARFYGPKKELFDKSWKLNDIEKIK